MTDPMSAESEPVSAEPERAAEHWPNSPWADDEVASERRSAHGPTASQAVLRFSVVVLLASTLVIFLSAIAASNATPNSPLERVSAVVHRASMFAMLGGFVGILAAYRIPAIAAFLQAGNQENQRADSQQRLLAPDMWFLLAASGLFIAWLWAATLLGPPFLHQINFWLLLVLAGLLANMAILHTGCVRSFAIGTLLTTVLVLFTWRSFFTSLMMGNLGFGLGRGTNPHMLFVIFSAEVTLSVISGLGCAFYHNLVMRVRSRVDRSPVTPT